MIKLRLLHVACCCHDREGAASKESYNEDTYPNLLHRFLKFEDEMSVINVVWRDCHQLIENYNEEQVQT